MMRATERVAAFRALHESGCFVIPNPWDVGGAKVLVQLGFPALATTSSGFAWSVGRSDHHVTLEEALGHFRAVVSAVDVPVNGDFEGGFAVEPEGVAGNVAAAAETGVAGLSIEDSTRDPERPLFDLPLAVERIRAAREAIDASGTSVLLTGRSEGFVWGRPDIVETIRRLRAYAEAGADCLFAPGLKTLADIESVVRAVAPKPVNVVVGTDFATHDGEVVRRKPAGVSGGRSVAWGSGFQSRVLRRSRKDRSLRQLLQGFVNTCRSCRRLRSFAFRG